MFNKVFNTNLEPKHTVADLFRKKQPCKQVKIILLLESLYFKQNGFDELKHYSLIDAEGSDYSLDYDLTIMSPHYKRISFLSHVLEHHSLDDVSNPFDSLVKLEGLIKSPQLYRNIIFYNSSQVIAFHIKHIIRELAVAIQELRASGDDMLYQQAKQEEGCSNLSPLRLEGYINELSDTLIYLKKIYNKIINH